jgi:LysR substrate binding domain
VVAAPIYLERYAVPSVPDDLTAHACLIHSSMPDPNTWRFTGPEGPLAVSVNGAFIANDSAAVLRAVRDGHGIALLLEIEVVDDLHAGRLCRLLKDYPSQMLPVHVIYPSRRNLAPRTRVVMDFVIEQTREIQALLATDRTLRTTGFAETKPATGRKTSKPRQEIENPLCDGRARRERQDESSPDRHFGRYQGEACDDNSGIPRDFNQTIYQDTKTIYQDTKRTCPQ